MHPVDHCEDFSMRGLWNNFTTDTLKKLSLVTGVVPQSNLIATGTALLVANIYYHSQHNVDVLSLFLDKKNPFWFIEVFIGQICLVVYTYFMKKTSLLIAVIVIDQILPQELTETAL